ncbi:hypothetical protein D3C74_134930 [compost metagenome]
MHWLKMYSRFLIVYFKQQLEYRFSFFGDILVNMLTFVTIYMGFWIIFNKFEVLEGWTYYEVMFLYNFNLVSYALSSMFVWGPMKQLEELIRKGDFDQFLTRPIPPLRLLIFRQFGHTFIGHIIVSIFVFGLCINRLNLEWSFQDYVYFIAAIIGATLIHCGIIIIAASSAFWVTRSTTIVDITIYAVRNYINYPINIYAKWLQLFLTFGIPYAFVNFYPATVLLGKNELAIHSSLAFGTPIVGLLLLALSLLLFNHGLTRYKSSGS